MPCACIESRWMSALCQRSTTEDGKNTRRKQVVLTTGCSRRRPSRNQMRTVVVLIAVLVLCVPSAARAQVPMELVHAFTGLTDPRTPVAAPLVEGADGNLY